MTNSKYKIVVMLNMLERLLREIRARHDPDWASAYGSTFAEHAPSIPDVCARADRRYATARLEAMLDDVGLRDTSLQASMAAPQATSIEQPRAA